MVDKIDASPTKRLVAFVLTKDIQLEDAVLDLIDNSIDGAKHHGGTALKGFTIKLDLSDTGFLIEDNCGGIDYERAKLYAFKFGRDEDYELNTGPTDVVGNFGVGMKRALLKMGKQIKIKSRTKSRYFEIEIDVDKWLKSKLWEFDFSNVRDEASPKHLCGTSISVTDLYPGVAERFKLKQFAAGLRSVVEVKQALALQQGLSIEIGGVAAAGTEMSLMQSAKILPYYQKVVMEESRGKVDVEIYAGVEESDNDKAGWYVICNGRTVLKADRSTVTGFGNKGDKIPAFHNQYARFRGYVFFHSELPELLPWNTAKSNVDMEHPFYRRAQQLMIESMKEVFGFLNELDREKDSTEQPLTKALANLHSVPLKKISVSKNFVIKVKTAPSKASSQLKHIKYKRPVKEVSDVMTALGITSADEAGEETFDLYVQAIKK